MSAPLPNPSSASRAAAAAAALQPGSALLPPRSAASRSPPAREAAHPFELPSSFAGNLGRIPARPYSDASGAMSLPPANPVDHPCGETPPHLTSSPKIFSTRAAIVREAKQGNAVADLGPVGSTSSPASLPLRTSMRPPVCMPTLLNSIISDSWSDEELMQFLAEDFLPENVIVGIDVSFIDPQDSCPGNIWQLNWSDDQQPHGNVETAIIKTEKGYWKCTDVLRMPTSTSIVGVKYNLEFYEGEAPSGKRTQWLMREYQVEQHDEANVPQEYKSLCTIFMQGSKKLNTEDELLSLSTNAPNDHLESYLQYLADMEEQNVSVNSKIVSSSQQNSSSREGKDIYEDYSAADGVDFVNALANEDYIEMKDLLSSDGSASTSEFSSRRSDEYFDSDALLRELLNDQNTSREIHQDCKHNIAGPTKSDRVVISPPEQGLVHKHDNAAVVAGTTLEKAASDSERDQLLHEQCLDHHPPASCCSENSYVEQSQSNSSTSSHGSTTSPQRSRSIGKLGKIGKKYCCLGSF